MKSSFLKYIDALEKIQKRFLKYLTFRKTQIYPLPGSDYVTLCNDFNFLTLAERRLIDQAIFIFKLLNHNISCPNLLNYIDFRVPRITSCYQQPFSLPMPRTAIGFTALFIQCVI